MNLSPNPVIRRGLTTCGIAGLAAVVAIGWAHYSGVPAAPAPIRYQAAIAAGPAAPTVVLPTAYQSTTQTKQTAKAKPKHTAKYTKHRATNSKHTVQQAHYHRHYHTHHHYYAHNYQGHRYYGGNYSYNGAYYHRGTAARSAYVAPAPAPPPAAYYHHHHSHRKAKIIGGSAIGGAVIGGIAGGGKGALIGGALGAGGGYLFNKFHHHH